MTTQPAVKELPNGPVMAALIAGGFGPAVIGLNTVLAEASPAFKNALNWWNPAGPLTGKSLVGVIAFFVAWLVLHVSLRNKDVNVLRATTIALFLLGLGLLGTFPPFFEAFTAK
jgi:hypothetical protein